MDRRSEAVETDDPVARPSAQARRARRRRMLAVPVSVAAHVLAVMALVWTHTDKANPDEGPLMTATLVEGPTLSDPPPAAAQATPAPTRPPSRPTHVRKTKAPVEDPELEADDEPAAPELTEADLAGAATASGSGTGAGGGTGGQCNMIRLLEAALRRDHAVQAAVSGAHRGKAMMVWNGDWVRSQGEDGKGLAVLREAISWEVGFAPAACRAQPVHGLVMLSLADHPGAPRLVLGGGVWRWSDVLNPRIERQ